MENTILENNLSAWEKKFCGSRVEIENKYKEWKKAKVKTIEVRTEISEDAKVILIVKKNNQERYLAGKRNCKDPITVWKQTQGFTKEGTIFFVGGIGNPWYIKGLISEHEEMNIVIYEPSKEIFFTVLETIDITDFFKKKANCIFIVDGVSGVKIDDIIKKMISVEVMDRIKTFILPNYEKIYAKEMLFFAKEIRKKCDSCAAYINTRTRFSNVFAQNLFANAPYVLDGYKTKQLIEVIPRDIPAIIVAAGPSLNKNIKELKKAKGRAFIIAVDTAIKPLLAEGIIPDMFAIVDGKKPIELVEKEEARNIPLLTSISAANSVLSYHTGKKFFYNEGYVYINSMFYRNGESFETVACGGSVATSAFALAFMIGIDTIILVGQDLALTGNKTHSDGTFQEKMETIDTSHSIMVPGNIEKEVPTRDDFKMYLEWYNQYIKDCKEYRKQFKVINATEGGAKIDGTEVMTLKDAIDRECKKEIDIQECFEKLHPVFDENERKKNLEFLQHTPEHYTEIRKAAIETNKLYKNLDKLCQHGNLDIRAYEKILKKIKKMTKKIEGDSIYYEPIQETLVLANYIVQSEQFDTMKTMQEEGKEIARQGVIYTDMVKQCAELFEEYTKETVGKAK